MTQPVEDNRRSGGERRKDVARAMTKTVKTADKVSRLVLVCLGVVLLLVIYVFITEHDGRQTVVESARAGCERDKLDRSAAVTLNDDILAVFDEAQKRNPKLASPARDRIIRDIEKENDGLRFRATINCDERYPDASWFP